MDLCVCESEVHEDGVGDGVNFYSVVRYTIVNGLTECVTRTEVWFRKKTFNLCACENEDHEHGVGVGVNTSLLSDTL